MSKHNIFAKKLKKQFLSINDLIESYFNRLRLFVLKFKKSKFSTNNKVILISGILVVSVICYFLIPSFYNKNEIQEEIKNQISKKYNIKIKFNDQIRYGLLPKPHFHAKKLAIIKNDREIANIKNTKIFISKNNFFTIENMEIKDLIFKNADFNIYKRDIIFFRELLTTQPNENKIIFKNCKIFYKSEDDQVLFINKVKNGQFYYDSNSLENILVSKNEIFKVPFKLQIRNDKFNKEIISLFDSKKIRLKIENKINYEKKDLEGIFELIFVNKGTSFNYLVKKNSLTFNSKNTNNNYNGNIDFKPFYFVSKFNYDGLSTKNLFNENSILIDFLKTDILNNKNLNAEIDLKVKDIINIDELNNLVLKTSIKQGDIDFSGSNINWRESLKISLNDSLLIQENGKINLIGKFIFDFIDINNFYRTFQIRKDLRKNIKQIKIDFVYNYNQKKISFDNAVIDNKSDIKIQEFLDNFNEKENRVFNKITFKQFINNFFRTYAG